MKILQIIPDLQLGGIQKAGIVLAKYFKAAGNDVQLIAFGPGPREKELIRASIPHRVCQQLNEMLETVKGFDPEIIHIHAASFENAGLAALLEAGRWPVVFTPVFGRPPQRRETLSVVMTCCVGAYTHSRLCAWLALKPATAFAKGIVWAPLTPYDQNDATSLVGEQNLPIEIPQGAFVVGRIARDDPLKWHAKSADWIDSLLAASERIHWLSVGFPDSEKERELRNKWGDRFINLPRITDSGVLYSVIRRLDVQFFASQCGECFSSSICEAACNGVPTVAVVRPFGDCGESEQVIAQSTGIRTASFSKALEFLLKLCNDTATVRALQRSTKEYALAHWSVDVVGAEILQYYEAHRTRHHRALIGTRFFKLGQAFASNYPANLIPPDEKWLNRAFLRTGLYFYHIYSLHQAVAAIRRIVRFARSGFQTSHDIYPR